jgi:hypothetical protein
MDFKHAFEILEIDGTASFSEVTQAYRDISFVWHPDRHSRNSRLAEKSHQKMKEINVAYDLLSSFYKEATLIKCKQCGTTNRVQILSGITSNCVKCQSDLFTEQTYTDNSEGDVCADGGCIGIIRNGHCGVCGKTPVSKKERIIYAAVGVIIGIISWLFAIISK